MTTSVRARSVELLDVSATGARLRGPNLPRAGDLVMIKIERVETFATVCWCRDDGCGVAFDTALTEPQLELLRREAHQARLMRLTPDQKLAMQDWTIGLAR